MYDIPVEVKVVLGSKMMRIKDVLRMGRNALIELDTKVDGEVELYCNNKLVAYGKILADGDKLCVEITRLVKSP